MKILIGKKYRWRHVSQEGLEFWYIGSEKAAQKIGDYCQSHSILTLERLRGEFCDNMGHYAIILRKGNQLIAAVDRIRSYPIFYTQGEHAFCVSNSARQLKAEYGLNEIKQRSLLEFCMSGYVTGRETLYQGLYQLQAGELLFRDGNGSAVERRRYYAFGGKDPSAEKEEGLLEALGEITNNVFWKAIAEAAGRPIWVPLSGGLDSRLVLCKLKELKYDNLRAFSYGPAGNYEAKIAEQVAAALDVPWIFVPTKNRPSRRFFHSDVRKDYWAFSDGLCSIPFMQDLDTLLCLRSAGHLTDDAVLINGQSGDFISGGHIPPSLMNGDGRVAQVLEAIIDKHFALWLHLMNEENLRIIRRKLLQVLEVREVDRFSPNENIGLYEQWESAERQSKYVVNGQRVYDFMDLSWELPLWDDEYLHFWEEVAPKHRFQQRLYRRYLEAYDYCGLFKGFSPTLWRWPGVSLAVVPVARLGQLILGRNFKERVYKYAGYFGHYRPHFAAFGLGYYMKNIPKARNAVSFYVHTWLQENLSVQGLL